MCKDFLGVKTEIRPFDIIELEVENLRVKEINYRDTPKHDINHILLKQVGIAFLVLFRYNVFDHQLGRTNLIKSERCVDTCVSVFAHKNQRVDRLPFHSFRRLKNMLY